MNKLIKMLKTLNPVTQQSTNNSPTTPIAIKSTMMWRGYSFLIHLFPCQSL